MQETAKIACIFNARNYILSIPILVESDTKILARPNGLHVIRQKHVKIFACACLLRTVYGPNVYREDVIHTYTTAQFNEQD
jgi:hypothetical protein